MDATITTIVPTYRRPQLLQRALRSVLRQTYANFRVCVYDNASGDDTQAVVERIAASDARVSYHLHASNIGGAANFLYGMRQVDTPFFSFLSDDDVLLPDFYAVALDAFSRCPSAYMTAASTVEVGDDGAVRYVPLALWQREGLYEPPEGAFAMLDNRHPTWTTILFRREALADVGYLDLAVGAPSDLDYELRVALRFPVAISFRQCGAYVSHAESGSVRETAAVVTGFERMRGNFAGDERIDPSVRQRLSSRLTRQLRMKLLEIWVKALVRGDDRAALEAATAMRDRYGPRAAGAILVAGWHLCTRAGLFRAALRRLEAVRLGARARRGGARIDAAVEQSIREALMP